MAEFFEILELSNGDIGLRKAGDEEEMIVTIQFSGNAKEHLKDHHLEVAHAMIEAGMNKIGELSGIELEHEDIFSAEESSELVH